MSTLDSILEAMEDAVRKDIPVGPTRWIDGAIKINALKGTLDNQIADFENDLIKLEAELIAEDMPSNKAKTLARAKTDYGEYLKAKAKAKRIEEFLRLAKKRAGINEFSV